MPTPEFAASFGRLAANHLWQSTGFAAVVVLLALALRSNHARARHWLWLAASVKFLVPFSVLAAIGSGLGRWFAPATPVSRLPFVIEQIVQPFAPIQDAVVPVAASADSPSLLPAVLLALWFCGFVAVLVYGWVRWRRVAAAVRASTALTEGRELEAWGRLAARQPARWLPTRLPTTARADWQSARSLASRPTTLRLVSSTAKLEPGVFGIFRPVLWLPSGIGDRLDDAELEAILAHEVCHIRRHDNLLAAIHMAVEAIFWFHPLVWWLGSRLEEERERACDEEVVRMGGEPQIYAESILKVCEFYLASPVPCAAGVTGGELKKRIEGIMTNRFTGELSYGKKLLLALFATVAVAAPIAIGLMNPPPGRGQSPGRLEFEVASVKTSALDVVKLQDLLRSGGTVGNGVYGDRAEYIYRTLRQLIVEAYQVLPFQVVGPDWLTSERFDVVCKMPAGSRKADAPLMLQSLLADRFKLIVHREPKEQNVSALVVAKGGPKLKESQPQEAPEDGSAKTEQPAGADPKKRDGSTHFAIGTVGYRFTLDNANCSAHLVSDGMTMAELAVHLTSLRSDGRPVVDMTGLTRTYQVALDIPFGAFGPGMVCATGASVPSANGPTPGPVQAGLDSGGNWAPRTLRGLGLELENRRAPVDQLIVDHVERKPTEN